MSENKIKLFLGLDFGTHQTKACVRFKKRVNEPMQHHFVPLNSDTADLDCLFLPSIVSVDHEKRFSYGKNNSNNYYRSYSFFKIASAEDEEFRTEVNPAGKTKYDKDKFEPYTPEFLAVIYIAKVLLRIRTYVKEELFKEDSRKPVSGFLSRFQKEKVTRDLEWYVQMGVPTEYQDYLNARRKRKFQQILLMAWDLSHRLDESELEQLQDTEIITEVESIFKSLTKEINHDFISEVNQDRWNKALTERNLSVYPETAAGLVFLVRSGKVTKDRYYLSMDIGGGSTDLSFFKVEANETFTYLASKSIMMAANDVAINMSNPGLTHNDLLMQLNRIFNEAGIEKNDEYRSAFTKTIKIINKAAYRMFNQQVWFRFEKMVARAHFNETTCYLYGGGSGLPLIDPNPEGMLVRIILHDNGFRYNLDTTDAFVKPMENLTLSERIKPSDWVERMRFLIVPLGLSLSLSDDKTTVFEKDFYTPKEIKKATKVYDVTRARWV